MKENIFNHLYAKYKKFKTKDLSLAIRCSDVAYIKNKSNTYNLVFMPKRYQIVTKCNDNEKIKYFTKKFGYQKTRYGKVPNFAAAPEHIMPSQKFYKCPTNHDEIIPAVQYFQTKYLHKISHEQHDFILGEPTFIQVAFSKNNMTLANTLSLENLIELEEFLNQSFLTQDIEEAEMNN